MHGVVAIMDYPEVKRSIHLEKSVTLLWFLEKSVTLLRFLEKSINTDLVFGKKGGIAEKSLVSKGSLGQWKEGRWGHLCFSKMDFSSFRLIISLIR